MKRAFKVKHKVFFVIFKGLSIAKNCLRPDSMPLSQNQESESFIPAESIESTVTKQEHLATIRYSITTSF